VKPAAWLLKQILRALETLGEVVGARLAVA